MAVDDDDSVHDNEIDDVGRDDDDNDDKDAVDDSEWY